MRRIDDLEDPRRRWLIEALAAGVALAGLPAGRALAQNVFGSRPTKLPEGQSIYRIDGTASVNGTPANLKTRIRPGDTVETGKSSEMVFVVGTQAMILRSQSRLVLEGEKNAVTSFLISVMRLVTGKVLSVSRGANTRILTPTATIGIRGTGWYAEADPELTYFCTCYGVTQIAANNDPNAMETVASAHHDRPLYIAGKAAKGKSISDAPFINHTDQELALIETLVGRAPPFVFPKDEYRRPRREY